MYLKPGDIKEVHLEVTSQCHLACPQCDRTINGLAHRGFTAKDMTLEMAQKIFSPKLCQSIKFLYINGCYGDIVSSQTGLSILRCLRERGVPVLQVHTSGSARGRAWWTELASLLHRPHDKVVFSIDGLSDTNSLYRVKSSWGKVMDSAQSFISAGGRARWEYLVFKHNEHQVESAKALAKEMGFVEFKLKFTTRYLSYDELLFSNKYSEVLNFEREGQKVQIAAPEKTHWRSKNLDRFGQILKEERSFTNYAQRTEITCQARKRSSIYIDFEGSVWPCCWVGTLKYQDHATKNRVNYDKLVERFGEGFNSMENHSLEEILSHPWYVADLENSWRTSGPKNPCLATCSRYCGQKFTSGSLESNYKMESLK